MNCQTFEPTINDLARGQIMEASLRENALAHAEDCARCGARLADERALNCNLRALAMSVETLEAPAQTETALLKSFRQRNASKTVPMLDSARQRRQRLLQWATAAAAAILTVFAIQAFRLRETFVPLHRASETASLSPLAVAFAPVKSSATVVPAKLTPESATQRRDAFSQPNRQAIAANYTTLSNKSSRATRGAQASQVESEIVTDFMPLTYGAAMSPNEGGQLVRVELPRSALISLGLPMNVEKSNERVKADVLLGHDGLARAIRFVR